MMNVDQVDIIVSFLMESGVRMILKDLQSALERGVKIRILTGNYLGITQPGALYLIKDYLGDQIDLRFYNKHYLKYKSDKALGFCCSRKHAEEMAKEFCLRNIPAATVYSASDGEYAEDRSEALRKLERGEIKVIFCVDMFNEGLDICDLDMVMFLRPTESPVVFLQQLGRGLRKSRVKEFLNVLDFIGNYEKAGSAPFLLSGRTYSSAEAGQLQQADFEFRTTVLWILICD